MPEQTEKVAFASPQNVRGFKFHLTVSLVRYGHEYGGDLEKLELDRLKQLHAAEHIDRPELPHVHGIG
jgi:hypothetical protein